MHCSYKGFQITYRWIHVTSSSVAGIASWPASIQLLLLIVNSSPISRAKQSELFKHSASSFHMMIVPRKHLGTLTKIAQARNKVASQWYCLGNLANWVPSKVEIPLGIVLLGLQYRNDRTNGDRTHCNFT